MHYTSRNDTLGFAHRTRKNLEHIEHAYKNGHDVHVVTQLVLSLLGLIVYPNERKLVERVNTLTLSELKDQGWPSWKIELGSPETLNQLIKMLRNAVAHGRIHFSSDDRVLDHVSIQFEDYDPRSKIVTWRATITSNDLEKFCQNFIKLIENEIG
ncbi:HEPN family nuclease [Vogesella sp. LYT5W]|uniref:HEPN family nuclease n=1 Tax=Vogesella margarita TaxID=2984199 RepID=A0ABT5IN37_9NEIS|nr:HEPN family nuclease [Vogesella margarita]MDC7713044.1 HEPN family nuclease [Vogesella margarita]